jgi:hypothetical protein
MRYVLFIVAAAALCGCAKEQKAAFTAACDGRVMSDIVIPANAKGAERYAAEELKYHLDKAFGAKWEIVTENEFNPSNYPYHFFIGATKATAAAGLPGKELIRDERILKTHWRSLYLLGNDTDVRYDLIGGHGTMNLGTIFAVYDFLENEMGVKWIWPGETGEVIPKRRTLAVGAIDRGGVEPLEDRFWYGAHFHGKEVMGFTGMDAAKKFFAAQRRFLLRHRCGVTKGVRRGHSFADWWKRFGETNPEYFNLLPDGKRRPFSSPGLVTMCVSQPGVWKQKVADWKAKYEKNKGVENALWVNACENDSAGLCQCRECRAWDAPDERFAKAPYWNGSIKAKEMDELRRKEGNYALSEFVGDNRWTIPTHDMASDYIPSLSDRYAKFYNKVAAEARKVDPRARVIGYAYENYIEAPKETKVDPAVMIEIVPRTYFPYDKEESEFFRRHMKGWREAGVKDFSLRPNFMLAGGNYLFDQGPVITEDFAFAYTNGMRSCAFDSLRGSWSAHALMLYALVRSFRDPLHGYEKAKAEILSAFGAAKEPIRRYLDKIRENTTRLSFAEIQKMAADNHTGSQSGGSFGNCTAIVGEFFNDRFFAEMNALLDEAVTLAKGNREITARIEFLRKGLRDTELTRKTRIAQKAHAADRKNAAKKAAFDAAFKAMNDYRASIEDEPVCNFNTAAFREWAGMRWPHVKVVK